MGSTTAASTTAPLRPQGQREQDQAKRRYPQPAPHASIITHITPFDFVSDARTMRPEWMEIEP
jgi:hypothetical protein